MQIPLLGWDVWLRQTAIRASQLLLSLPVLTSLLTRSIQFANGHGPGTPL